MSSGVRGARRSFSRFPLLRARWKLDFVIVNGENAAGGFGLTETILEEFLAAGVDAVTLGNHAFDQREALVFIERQPRLIRPANYPPARRGAARRSSRARRARGSSSSTCSAASSWRRSTIRSPRSTGSSPPTRWASLRRRHGRRPRRGDQRKMRRSAISPTGGRALVVGTHTHVPSADHRILAGGTGFVTDVGMTGDYNSVIGMEKEEPLRRFTRRIPSGRFEPALGPATLCGVAVETGPDGLAKAIAPVRIGGLLSAAEPDFWN